MMGLNHKVLAEAFFWFAITMAIFGVATQVSQQLIFASPFFYIELSMFGMLGAIYTSRR